MSTPGGGARCADRGLLRVLAAAPDSSPQSGQLGHGNRSSVPAPIRVMGLRGKHIVEISAGGAHSAAISSHGARAARCSVGVHAERVLQVCCTHGEVTCTCNWV